MLVDVWVGMRTRMPVQLFDGTASAGEQNRHRARGCSISAQAAAMPPFYNWQAPFWSGRGWCGSGRPQPHPSQPSLVMRRHTPVHHIVIVPLALMP